MRTFQATGDMGDLIYLLPVIRHLGGGVLKLKSEPRITRTLTHAMFDSLAGIMKPQEYIEDVVWADGARVEHDFTLFRSHYQPLRTLVATQAAYRNIFGVDTHSAWIAPPQVIKHGRPVIARSPRYHNPEWQGIWPEILARYPNALFIGHEAEHGAFCAEFGHVEKAPTKDFVEMAAIIAGASIFIGNQSAPYALAEAMKVDSIQETHPKQRDCIFGRENGAFLRTYAEWTALRDGRPRDQVIMLALQFHPATQEQTEALLDLICDIEPTVRSDVEFCLSARRDVDPELLMRLKARALQKFTVVHTITGKRMGTGWPMGPNDMWSETMMRISCLNRDGKTNAKAILTFEPDCVPLRADWINALKEAWWRADRHGKYCCGHQEGSPDHINGNALFRISIQQKHPELYGSSGHEGWDCLHGKLLLEIGEDTAAISQRYQWDNYTFDDLLAIRKHGKVPALFHGTKGMNGIAFVRRMLESGELHRRAQ